MKLEKFTDVQTGEDVWINPEHVAGVRTIGNDQVHVVVMQLGDLFVRADSAEHVAQRLDDRFATG